MHPLLFGIQWMDPNGCSTSSAPQFFWVSLLIIFIECGLFFPFLPGDTLLFAMGLFIATGQIDVIPGGDAGQPGLRAGRAHRPAPSPATSCGYEIGRRIGPPLYERDGRLLKQKYFDKTAEFFDKHGNKALVIGRFVPFVRTYITVVAGVVRMQRRRFFVLERGRRRPLGDRASRCSATSSARPCRALGENIDMAILGDPRASR